MKKIFSLSFYIITFIIFISLGLWQVERLEWKNNLIELYEKNILVPTTSLPTNFDLKKNLFKHYHLECNFHNQASFFMMNKKSQELGYNIYTICTLSDKRNVIVNRGWITESNKQKILSQKNQIEQIETALLEESKIHNFTPSSDYKHKIITMLSLAEIQDFMNINLEPYYFVQTKHSNELITPEKLNIQFHNYHLVYCITWFSLAFVNLIFFIFHLTKVFGGKKN